MNFKIFNFPLLICQIKEYPLILINWLDGSSIQAFHFYFEFFQNLQELQSVFMNSYIWIHSANTR